MRFQCFLLGLIGLPSACWTWHMQLGRPSSPKHGSRPVTQLGPLPKNPPRSLEQTHNTQMSEPRNKNSVHPALAGAKGRRPLQYNLPLTRNLPASSHFCYQIPWVENFDLQSQCWQARLCRCSKQQAHTINLGEKHMVQSYETKDPCIVKTRDPHRRWFTTRFFENNTVDHVIIQVQIRCQTRLKALSWMTGAMSILHVGKNVTTPQAWPHPPDKGKALTNYMIFQHLDSTIFAKFWII